MKTLASLIIVALAMAQGGRAEEETPSSAPMADVPVLQAQDTAALESKVGSEVIVEGMVQQVGTGPNDGIKFLNFGDRRTGFVAVIFKASFSKFPEGFDQYLHQKVRVRGTLEKFRDKQIQIKVDAPDQLEIVSATVP